MLFSEYFVGFSTSMKERRSVIRDCKGKCPVEPEYCMIRTIALRYVVVRCGRDSRAQGIM